MNEPGPQLDSPSLPCLKNPNCHKAPSFHPLSSLHTSIQTSTLNMPPPQAHQMQQPHSALFARLSYISTQHSDRSALDRLNTGRQEPGHGQTYSRGHDGDGRWGGEPADGEGRQPRTALAAILGCQPAHDSSSRPCALTRSMPAFMVLICAQQGHVRGRRGPGTVVAGHRSLGRGPATSVQCWSCPKRSMPKHRLMSAFAACA